MFKSGILAPGNIYTTIIANLTVNSLDLINPID